MTPIDLLTVPELLGRARISRSTFYALVRRGEGPPLLKLGARTFIDRAEAEAWLRARQRGAPHKRRIMGDRAAIHNTGLILRQMAHPNHLLVLFALADGAEHTLEAVTEATGLDRAAVRHALTSLRALVAVRKDDGATRARLPDTETRRLVEAVYSYHSATL